MSQRFLVEFKQWSAAGKPTLCRNVVYGRDVNHALETFRNRRPDREVTYVWQDITPDSVRKFQKTNRKALDR